MSAGQVGAGQVGAAQVGAGQVGEVQECAGQVGAVQFDFGQTTASQAGPWPVGAGQVDAGQVDAGHLGRVAQVRRFHVRTDRCFHAGVGQPFSSVPHKLTHHNRRTGEQRPTSSATTLAAELLGAVPRSSAKASARNNGAPISDT